MAFTFYSRYDTVLLQWGAPRGSRYERHVSAGALYSGNAGPLRPEARILEKCRRRAKLAKASLELNGFDCLPCVSPIVGAPIGDRSLAGAMAKRRPGSCIIWSLGTVFFRLVRPCFAMVR